MTLVIAYVIKNKDLTTLMKNSSKHKIKIIKKIKLSAKKNCFNIFQTEWFPVTRVSDTPFTFIFLSRTFIKSYKLGYGIWNL